MQLVDTLSEIKTHYGFKTREFQSFKFGSVEQCKIMLSEAIILVDKSIGELKWLPEYDQVANWMSDTEGKGLFLSGDCGRGKSNIIMFALPLLFWHCQKKIIKPLHVDDLHEHIGSLTKRKIISIDEIGAEPISSDYGSKYFPFMKVINAAEMNSATLLLSSNLNSEQMRYKYDERTLDRIVRLCKVVKFSGESLRK